MARAHSEVPDAGNVSWEIQELVTGPEGSPAREMKFYMFYGEIGLIQEVSKHPRAEFQFFRDDGSVADCGRDHQKRFLDPADTVTDKGGLSDEKLDAVRRFSLALPVPFMRIDLLNRTDDMVFLEFSAAPGMSHTFNDRYDLLLGKMHNQAMVRLNNDLLEGKTFDVFQTWAQEHSRVSAGRV